MTVRSGTKSYSKRGILVRPPWKITALSDGSVRVKVNGDALLEKWTWHGPSEHSGIVTLTKMKRAETWVEHFELDGNAVLALEIEPLTAR